MITPAWCLELVLAALIKAPFESIVTCPLKYLTWKTAFLLPVTSTRRASEMHMPELLIRFSNAGVTLLTSLRFFPKVANKVNTSRPIFVLCASDAQKV